MQVDVKKDELETSMNVGVTKIQINLSSTNKDQLQALFKNFTTKFSSEVESEEFTKQVGVVPTLKTPCGQGTKTWSKYKMIIHQASIIVKASHERLEQIVEYLNEFSHINIDMIVFN